MEEEKDIDLIVMELITHAGSARSLAIEAIRCARAGDFGQAEDKMKECDAELVEAHHAQTDLLVAETQGTPVTVTLLLVHAQDHIMNAMTVKDLATELIETMRTFQ